MKLSEIQAKLKAPKGQFNKFGKYKYRSCEDILESVKPLLGDSTITITDEIINIGDRYYIKSTVTFKNDKENVSVSAFARESATKKGMDDSQVTGAASSYARKYALNGLLLIDDAKDADANEGQADRNKSIEKQKNSNNQKKNFSKLDNDIQNAFYHITVNGKNGKDLSIEAGLLRDLGVRTMEEIFSRPDEDKNDMLDFLRRKYASLKQKKVV